MRKKIIALPRNIKIRLHVFLCFTLTLMGCAHVVQPPSEEIRTHLGKIGIVSADSLPKYDFKTFAVGRSSGALTGAGISSLDLFMRTFPFGIFLWPVGAAYGAIEGYGRSVPEVAVKESETLANTALVGHVIQQKMSEQVLKKCLSLKDYHFQLLKINRQNPSTRDPDYRFLNNEVDTIIELDTMTIGFRGEGGDDPSIYFFMNVRARLIQANDNKVLFSQDFEYRSMQRRLQEWKANDAQLLVKERDRCYKDLADRIADELFLESNFVRGQRMTFEACGINILYPEQNRLDFPKPGLSYVVIDSIQPTMKWEPFPAPKDKETDETGIRGKIKEVTYELKIWKVYGNFPDELSYHREDIKETSHRLETALEYARNYYWTVRAQFELNGRTRTTTWAYSKLPMSDLDPYGQGGYRDPCRLNYIPIDNYYRFTTPSR